MHFPDGRWIYNIGSGQAGKRGILELPADGNPGIIRKARQLQEFKQATQVTWITKTVKSRPGYCYHNAGQDTARICALSYAWPAQAGIPKRKCPNIFVLHTGILARIFSTFILVMISRKRRHFSLKRWVSLVNRDIHIAGTFLRLLPRGVIA